MHDSVDLVVYWQKNSFQNYLREECLFHSNLTLGICGLLCTWDALLEVMRREERCCGRDVACTNCDLCIL